MTRFDFFDALRALNAALGLVCLLLMLWQMPLWRALPPPWRVVGMGMAMLVVAVIIGCVESLFLTGEPVTRVPLTTVSLFWLTYGLLRAQRIPMRRADDPKRSGPLRRWSD